MSKPTCLCGICSTCKARATWHRWFARQKAAEAQNKAVQTAPAPRKRRKSSTRIPTHARALRFNAKKRPYDPVEAAEHIIAVFMECPAKDKPHLLARIEMLVRDVSESYGGFRFQDISAD